MKKQLFVAIATALSIISCTTLQSSKKEPVDAPTKQVVVEKNEPVYQASKTRVIDLLHTKLEVSFDWEKQFLLGKANLTLTPYFYNLSTFQINAKGMEIKSVTQIDTAGRATPVQYSYDSTFITVSFPKSLTRKDTIELAIEYISKPNQFRGKGSEAINDDKGLYFINPLGRDTVKPQQLWTQGETEASSVWFPTIDVPNEKTTQEIYITVQDRFKTLSNGLLLESKKNNDGTRTDYWRQKMPHAPYLFMMAVGEFALVQDEWEGIPVNYLVEPKDSAEAKNVFGNTPEMLSFYSKILGYKYPWDKYNQIVVSDYVSGAMENTGAVIHGKWVFRTKQQQIDHDNEDVIAHELFHHWFGDLVTCESWSNLPLNESFATYGEYLWIEHKYCKTKADRHLYVDMTRYLTDTPRVNLIRYHYDDKEDMFDRHSYEKGGRILHLLRDVVGDDAFFESLKLYLHRNAFGTVEVHDLRLAFEEVSGMDLNWFFNQWFLDKGHPILKVRQGMQGDSLVVSVEQIQGGEFPVFKFPVRIDIYENGKATQKNVWVNKQKEIYKFDVIDTPQFVNFDAKKVLLAQIDYPITASEALFQYTNSELYKDKLEALYAARLDTSADAWDVFEKASRDSFEHFRKIAYYFWSEIPDGKTEEHKEKLIRVAQEDESSAVRIAAISMLRKTWPKDSSLASVYKRALSDSSAYVLQTALFALNSIAREDALLRAYELEKNTDPGIISTLAYLYADVKDESKRKWYDWAIQQVEASTKVDVIQSYTEYLKTKGNEVVWKAVKKLKEEAIYENNKDVRQASAFAILDLRKRNLERIKDIKKDIRDKKASTNGKPYDLKLLEEKYKELQAHDDKLKVVLEEIYNNETNAVIKESYDEAGLIILTAPENEEVEVEKE